MMKPVPTKALPRLLLLAGCLTGSHCALAQMLPIEVALPPRAASSTATLPTVSAADSVANSTLFIPSVTDENTEPLAGVTVASANGSLKAVTDSVGQVRLAVGPGEILVLSIEGSEVQRYVVGRIRRPILLLDTHNPAVARLKPVRLLFNSSIRPDLTAASTQTIYYRDLQKFPVSTFLNALAGQAAGLQAIQGSGRPNADVAGVNLLGQNPTIIIDGVVRANTSLDPVTSFDLEEIESVTVLKDALATSMLGVRNTNGGILNITTRRGTPGQPRISFTVQTAIQQPLKQPTALDAYNYASLYNEARVNDGLAPAYTAGDLQKYQDGSDPIGHPNVDWADQVLKKSSRLDRYTFSASGGNNFSKYFVSLENLNQTGLLKNSDINAYNTSNDYAAYTLRSNIDLQLNKKLSGGIRLLGRLLNGNDAGATVDGVIQSLYRTPANAYPVTNPNGTYGGSQQFQNNLYAQTVGSGYRQNYKRNVIADFYLQRSLDEVTPGLFIRGTGSYYASLSENLARNKTFATTLQNPDGTYQTFGTNGDQANGNSISYQSNTTYVEAALGYNRQFGAQGLNAILVESRQSTNTGSDLPYVVLGTSGRFSYNYKQKYVAEFAFGLNGSNYYPGGNTKYGFFPAGGLAWNLSREDFMASQKWLSFLKLYGSFGLTGNDNPGYFGYLQTYGGGSAVYFGSGAGTVSTNTEQTLASTNRAYEKGQKLSAGIQGAVLNNHLGFTVEYYNSLYTDLLMQRGRNTALLGQAYPDENIGRTRYFGVTGQLTWQQSMGDFGVFASANIGVQNSSVVFVDEVNRPYSWMQVTGQPVGQRFGYVSEGLFQSPADIAGHATLQGYTPQPGDIKYKDLNGDGVINQLDMAPIGGGRPAVPFGATLGAHWKGFDCSVLLQGALNRQVYLSGETEYAFQNGGFGAAFTQHLDRWTPTNPDGTYPRLNLGANANNFATSTFWLHDDNYLRIKNVELGYTLPIALSQKARLQGVRLFCNATNVLTFSQYDRIDPEVYNAAYPIQRLLNFGFNIKL